MADEKETIEQKVRTIRRATRKKYSAEDTRACASGAGKMRIVLEGLRGETKIRELCRREGIATNLYYTWSKEFLEAGKERLIGDTARQADSRDVTALRKENAELTRACAQVQASSW